MTDRADRDKDPRTARAGHMSERARDTGDERPTWEPPQAEPLVEPSSEHTVYLGLGSNLGDRVAALRAAVAALAPFVRIADVSSVYETAPLHVTDQPDFLNIVVRGKTRLAPVTLLRAAKQIEAQLGRAPGPRFGPRLIDIDLLLYDDLRLSTPELTLPHPRMAERGFVLAPLTEIAPHVLHPERHEEVAALAAAVASADVRRIGPLL